VLRAQARHRGSWRAGLAAVILLAVVAGLWLGPGRPPGATVAPTGAATGCIQPPCPPGASCLAIAPDVTFTAAINGTSAANRNDGSAPGYQVRPGEYLAMRVAVTVPGHVRVTALWFGISEGSYGYGPQGPTGMNPVLDHYSQPLSAGSYMFGFWWRIPQRPGASLYLTFAWSSYCASVTGPVAQLILN
jgi:hypothetical protein